ncbi:MAG: hypothetical protein IJT43_12785 [Stomatobaculum sp.]|nr:hypothetical protein [Stomatobaculum sp.]
MLSEIDQKLLAYEAFLKKYPARCGREALLLEESPGIRELLLPQLLKLPDDLELWAREEYDKNMDYPDHLKYPTIRGELVRSKSETQISYVLAKNSIPYRYECRLPLDGVSIYPDFTTLRPFDRKIIIWEHFGLLDKPAYIDNTTSKLNLYIKNGWIPGNNLIITTETEKYPLDIRQIEELVKFHYFPG